MKKPEKKESISRDIAIVNYEMGYNQAIDDYEKWLPNKEELLSILIQTLKENNGCQDDYNGCSFDKKYANAIAERLGR